MLQVSVMIDGYLPSKKGPVYHVFYTIVDEERGVCTGASNSYVSLSALVRDILMDSLDPDLSPDPQVGIKESINFWVNRNGGFNIKGRVPRDTQERIESLICDPSLLNKVTKELHGEVPVS